MQGFPPVTFILGQPLQEKDGPGEKVEAQISAKRFILGYAYWIIGSFGHGLGLNEMSSLSAIPVNQTGFRACF